VALLMPLAQEAAARWHSLRVALDISNAELRQSVVEMLQEFFELELIDQETSLPISATDGLVMVQLPTAERAELLHQHGCLPQLVISEKAESGSSHEWSEVLKLPPAFTMRATNDMPELHNLILQLGSHSHVWPDCRIALLAPPGYSRRLLGEGLAAQYRLHRVCPAQQLQLRAEAGDDEVIEALREGKLAADDLVADVIEQQLQDAFDGTERGLLLDGFPRTAAQAEALQKAGCAPQVVLVLDGPPRTATPLSDAKTATHEAHHPEVVSWFEQQGVLVLHVDADRGAHEVAQTLGLLMTRLEENCAMLSVPYPIELQAAGLPTVRTDPPHKLSSSKPEMAPGVVCDVLTDELWSKLKLLVTPLGTTLAKCIEPCVLPAAAASQASTEDATGLVACDEHSIELFEPVFTPVLQELHGCTVHDNFAALLPHRLDTTADLSEKHVTSICVSARRNLNGLALAPSLSSLEIAQIEQMLKLSFSDLCSSSSFGGRYWHVNALNDHKRICCKQVDEEFSEHMMAADVDSQLLHRLEQQRNSDDGLGIWVSADRCSAAWSSKRIT